jgi:elongator complex protein 2
LTLRPETGTEEADQLKPASNDPYEAVTALDFSVGSKPPLEEQLLGSTLWPEVGFRSRLQDIMH